MLVHPNMSSSSSRCLQLLPIQYMVSDKSQQWAVFTGTKVVGIAGGMHRSGQTSDYLLSSSPFLLPQITSVFNLLIIATSPAFIYRHLWFLIPSFLSLSPHFYSMSCLACSLWETSTNQHWLIELHFSKSRSKDTKSYLKPGMSYYDHQGEL